MKINQLYPSRWLKAADVTKPLLATIRSVAIEEITENEETKPVLRFVGDVKPMVLNRTNSASIAELYGDDTDKWIGKSIVLFTTKVQYQSKLVDAIRCRAPKQQPVAPSAPAAVKASSAPASPSKTSEELAAAVSDGNDDVPF